MADNMPLVARIMVEHGGGGPPKGPGMASAGGDDTGDAPQSLTIFGKMKDVAEKALKIDKSQLAKTIGINVGTASILKQSQVFTGYIGTIFQLMGALVDVILAPFLPIMIPAIKLLASFIPIAQKIMNNTMGYIIMGFDTVAGWIAKLYDLLPQPFKTIGSGVGKAVKYALVSVLIGMFLAKMLGVGKIYNTLLIGAFKLGWQALGLAYFKATSRHLPFLKKQAETDKAVESMAEHATRGNSIFVKDILARRANSAGMASLGQGNARNAKGASRLMTRMSGRMGRLTSVSSKFFGKNLMRIGGLGILLTGMTGLLGRGLSSLKDGLGAGFSAVKRGIGIGTDAVTRLVPRIPVAVNNSKTVLSRILNGAKTAAFATGRFIAGGATIGFNAVKGGVATAWTKITGGLGTAKEFIGGKMTAAKNGIKGGLTTAWSKITGGIGTAWGKITGGLTIAKNAIGTGITSAKSAITSGLTNAKTFIGTGLTNAKDALRTSLISVRSGLAKKLGIEGLKAKAAMTLIRFRLAAKLGEVGGKITRGLSTLGSTIGGFFGGMGRLLKKIPGVSKAIDVAKGIKDGAVAGAKATGRFFKGIFGRGKGAVAGGVQDLGEKAAEKTGKGLFGRIISPITKAAPMLGKAARLVPGLNVAAEVVLGTYKTVQAFRKYGMKGGLATAGFATTAVGAAAAGNLAPGVGTIASAGYSIGGYMALDNLMEAKFARRDSSTSNQGRLPQPLNLTIVQETGIGTPLEQHQERAQSDANGAFTVRVQSQANLPGGRQ